MRTASLLLVSITLAWTPLASAQEVRFDQLLRGGLAFTGNTLGLSSARGDGPGNEDSIGTFIALDPSAREGTAWPLGTTADWRANGSSGVLDLPPGAEVVYAELMWGGSFEYGGENVTASLEDAVRLSHEGGASLEVSPAPETAHTVARTGPSGEPIRYYTRSADVTALVREHGAGEWTTSGVPATQSIVVSTANAAGWSLYVVYRDASAPMRRVRVVANGEWVDVDSSAMSTTPSCRPSGGSVVISALEGDVSRVGDQIAAGEGSSLVTLSGPNNPATNAFASQINDATGALDVRGSFGAANHDALLGLASAGGRQGFDLSALSLDAAIPTDADSLVLVASTTGDAYLLGMLALVLEEESADLAVAARATAAPTSGPVGTVFTITLALDLSDDDVGLAAGLVAVPLPSGWSLVAARVDGAAVTTDAAGLADGLSIGDVAAGAMRTIELDVQADGLASFLADATIRTAHPTCVEQPVATFVLPLPSLEVVAGEDAGALDAGAPDVGTTDAAGLDAGANDAGAIAPIDAGADAGSAAEGAGCGCRAGHREQASGAWMLVAALAWCAVRRRR